VAYPAQCSAPLDEGAAPVPVRGQALPAGSGEDPVSGNQHVCGLGNGPHVSQAGQSTFVAR
jgi:hypothetical protein